jgi:hypothetical protein
MVFFRGVLPGPVWRTEPLRDDPLEAERAGVLEDDRPVGLEMQIERDPVASVIGEHGLAALDRLPPKVLAVEFDQIESAEQGGVVVLPIADQIEDRDRPY